jgi:phosphoglycolate phosphatase
MHREPPGETPFDLLDEADCLLLDFDGPVCELFADGPADLITANMHRYLLDEHGIRPARPATPANTDPYEIIRRPWPPGVAAALEAILAEGEAHAVRSAPLTPGVDVFVRAVSESGRLLAITTNNSAGAVETYLKDHSLEGYFGWRIFGRDPDDPALMKPHPECLLRAMAALDMRAGQCLMVGDSPRDAQAAKAAGIPFLGYARSRDRVAGLREADPHPVVVGMEELAAAARGLSRRPIG